MTALAGGESDVVAAWRALAAPAAPARSPAAEGVDATRHSLPPVAALLQLVAVLGRPPAPADATQSPLPAATTPAARGSPYASPLPGDGASVGSGVSEGGVALASPVTCGGGDRVSPVAAPFAAPAPLQGLSGEGHAASRLAQAGVLLQGAGKAVLPAVLQLLQPSAPAALSPAEFALLLPVVAAWAARVPPSAGQELWTPLRAGVQAVARCTASPSDAVVWLPAWGAGAFMARYLTVLAAPHAPAAWAHVGSPEAPLTAPTAVALLTWDALAAVVAAAAAAVAPGALITLPGAPTPHPASTWGIVGVPGRRKDAATLAAALAAGVEAVTALAALPLRGAAAGASAAASALATAMLARGVAAVDVSPAVGPTAAPAAPPAAPLQAVAPPALPAVPTEGGSSSPGGSPPSEERAKTPRGSLEPSMWRGETGEQASFRQSRRHLALALHPALAEGAGAGDGDGGGEEQAPPRQSTAGSGHASDSDGSDGGWDDWDEESSSTASEGGDAVRLPGAAAGGTPTAAEAVQAAALTEAATALLASPAAAGIPPALVEALAAAVAAGFG